MVNDQVGVNGRKIDLIALDDRYIPAKTVEATRRLVEPGQVLPMFGQLGTPTNIAVWQYLNAHHIPQLLVTTVRTA
jgi:branched-chain amino acid transport system substrate-binding protein